MNPCRTLALRQGFEPLPDYWLYVKLTPIINYQLPIPNSQFPIPNSQFPIPNSQLPITHYPLPITK
ncbi:MAG: hypothetical protein ACRC62_27680 [Microcoleus sp.]